VTAPDWGQDHLSLEAIVAFVDGELAAGPHARATAHLEQCPECSAQVTAQRAARSELRTAGCPLLSSALLSSLRSIPQETDLPGPPAGLAMTPDGQLVSVVRPERMVTPQDPPPGFRADSARPEHHAAARPTRSSPVRRRIGVGTGVAVSGLALGALAFGGSFAAPSSPAPAPTTAADRGLPLGSSVGGPSGALDARLRLGTSNPTPGSGEPRSGRLFR